MRSARRRPLPAHVQRALRAVQPQRATKSRKYNNRIVYDAYGVVYESELERDVMRELNALQRRRLISRWVWGPRFVLQQDPTQPNTLVTYRPDFMAWPADGGLLIAGLTLTDWFVIDAKGKRTAPFNLKVRQWKVRYPTHKLLLVTRKDGWIAA